MKKSFNKYIERIKKYMKKKGFTLIELLAVIVILAVIAIIVTPMIASTVNSAKSSSLKSSAQSIVDATEQYCTRLLTTENEIEPKSYLLDKATADKLGFSYNADISGYVSYDSNCKVTIGATNGTSQVTKDSDSDEYNLQAKQADFTIGQTKESTPESCFTLDTEYSSSYPDEAAISKYTCADTKNVVIPGTIGGKAVVKLDEGMFKGMTLDSVDLSNLSELTVLYISTFEGATIGTLNITNMINLRDIRPLYYYVTKTDSNIEYLAANELDNGSVLKIYTCSSIYYKIDTININNLPLIRYIDDFNDSYRGCGYHLMANNINISDISSLDYLDVGAFYSAGVQNLTISNMKNLYKLDNRYYHNYSVLKSLILKDLPLLDTIDGGTFFRNIYSYTDSGGNKITIDSCKPSYTFDNIPNIKTYDENEWVGLSPYAFGALATDETMCTGTPVSSCGDEVPTVTYVNTVSDVLRNYDYKALIIEQCME